MHRPVIASTQASVSWDVWERQPCSVSFGASFSLSVQTSRLYVSSALLCSGSREQTLCRLPYQRLHQHLEIRRGFVRQPTRFARYR